MAAIAPKVTVLNAATLKIAANNYETSVSKCQLTPSTPKSKFKGIGGNSLGAIGTPDWTLELTGLQDWDTPNSFSKYMLENAGQIVVADFYPKAGGAGYRASILLEPSAIGGDVDAELDATVSLTVMGQPAVITVP